MINTRAGKRQCSSLDSPKWLHGVRQQFINMQQGSIDELFTMRWIHLKRSRDRLKVQKWPAREELKLA